MAQDPIAALFTTILDRLEALVPVAEQAKANLIDDPEPGEPAEAGIEIGTLFPDEDGFWDGVRQVKPCALLAGSDTDSAHLVFQRTANVQPLVDAFEDLLDRLDTACPTFHWSFLRLNVTAWRHSPGQDIQFGAYLYGKALSGMSEGGNVERGERFATLVRALAPLDKPTHWWMIEADGCPVAAAGCLEARAVYRALDDAAFDLKSWLQAKTQDPTAHALRLTAPEDIRASALQLLAKA
jgi:hypothetical protein